MLHWLLALSVTVPFTDVHKRFTVELPEGFRFAPMPGDLEGVTFALDQSGSTGYVVVRIFPKSQGATTETAGRDLLRVLEKQPGQRVLSEGPCVLGGVAAHCRRSVHDIQTRTRSGTQTDTKMQEDAVFVQGDTVYMVHTETLAAVYGSFEAPFLALRNTVRFTDVRSQDPELGLLVSPVVGRWRMRSDKSVVFELRADGTFALMGSTGTFRVDGATLLTQAKGGAEESFTWEVLNNELVLRATAFDEPIRYERVGKKKAQP